MFIQYKAQEPHMVEGFEMMLYECQKRRKEMQVMQKIKQFGGLLHKVAVNRKNLFLYEIRSHSWDTQGMWIIRPSLSVMMGLSYKEGTKECIFSEHLPWKYLQRNEVELLIEERRPCDVTSVGNVYGGK